jgi:hypothetical protein
LRRNWPHFEALLNEIPDHRKRKTYDVGEILMAGLSMFMFKRGSRNNMDKTIKGEFERNYITLWGLRLPIMETVDKFLRELPPEEIENLKHELVRSLIRRKSLERWKFNNRYIVSVDGTGLMSFDYEPFPGCPYKEYKNGSKTWTAYALEAKLCCGNGISISLNTVWLDSSENIEDDKQDCELKAFRRLAEKLKKTYPRLPMIIVADSLYPNQTCFDICKQNRWNYIFTLKDGCLKSIQDEVAQLRPLAEQQENKQENALYEDKKIKKEIFEFINHLEYQKKYHLNWLEYNKMTNNEVEQRFTHITNITITKKNVRNISCNGRLRWLIENQGFNTQKNSGYKLQHKYSRKNYFSMQNYYHLLQIAHMVMQLVEKLERIKQQLKDAGMTILATIDDMVSTMTKECITQEEIVKEFNQTKQLRYTRAR